MHTNLKPKSWKYIPLNLTKLSRQCNKHCTLESCSFLNSKNETKKLIASGPHDYGKRKIWTVPAKVSETRVCGGGGKVGENDFKRPITGGIGLKKITSEIVLQDNKSTSVNLHDSF